MSSGDPGYGIEAPRGHGAGPRREPARYLIVISEGGPMVARLLGADREPVAAFDASTEEVARMTQGLKSSAGADAAEWDRALRGHSLDERRSAEVYTLDL